MRYVTHIRTRTCGAWSPLPTITQSITLSHRGMGHVTHVNLTCRISHVTFKHSHTYIEPCHTYTHTYLRICYVARVHARACTVWSPSPIITRDTKLSHTRIMSHIYYTQTRKCSMSQVYTHEPASFGLHHPSSHETPKYHTQESCQAHICHTHTHTYLQMRHVTQTCASWSPFWGGYDW